MRLLSKVLLLITLVLIIGNWLLADVGYVLIRYGHIAIETSLFIAVLTGIGFLFIFFKLIRLLPNHKYAHHKSTASDQTADNKPTTNAIDTHLIQQKPNEPKKKTTPHKSY